MDCHIPRDDIDVGNTICALSGTYEPLSVFQSDVQDVVEPFGFILVAFLGVWNIFGGSAVEVVRLALLIEERGVRKGI